MDNSLNLMIAKGLGPEAPAWDYQKAQANALTIQGGELDLQNKQRDLELRPFKDEMAVLSYLRDVAPSITQQNYHLFYEDAVTKKKINPSFLPNPQEVMQLPPQEYEKRKWDSFATIDQKLKVLMHEERIRSAEALVGQRIESSEKISGERLSSAEKIAEARDKQLRELVEIRAKHAEELQKIKSEGENLTEDQRIARALKTELGREPTDREVLDEKQRIYTQKGEKRIVGYDKDNNPIFANPREAAPKPIGEPGEAPPEVGSKKTALPAEKAMELADLSRTYKQLEDITKKTESLKDKFGPIEGRYNKLKVKFASDGPTQEIINELETLITIAYGLSGKQITVQEMAILKSAILPRLEQPYENFSATLKFATNWLASTHNERLDYYKKSRYLTDIEPLGKKAKTVGRFKIEVE